MSALRANPAPLLPSHVGVVIGLAVAKNLNSFSLQLFHPPPPVIRAATEVLNTLPPLFPATATRSARAAPPELHFGPINLHAPPPLPAPALPTANFATFPPT